MKNKWKFYVLPALAVAGAFVFQSCDDDDDLKMSDIPQTVQQNFQSQYPNVQWVEWEAEWGNYKADFFFNGTVAEWELDLNTQAEAWYSQEGEWLRTEFNVENYYFNPLSTDVIPQAVRETISNIAGGRQVEDVDRVDMPGGINGDYFDVEIENEPNDIYMKIGFDGTQLQ